MAVMRPVTLHHGGSPTARWRAALGPPRRHLSRVVETYAEYEEFSISPIARRELPAPRTVLIIELAAPLLAAGASTDETAMRPTTAFLGAPGRGPATTWHAGAQHCIEVRLTQLGVYRLFGSMQDLGGRIVPFDALWGSAAEALTERLVAANSWESRFGILDQVLGAALTSGPEPDPEVVHTWTRLRRAGGDLAIRELVAEIGWSRGRLAHRFRAQTGLTPKAAATLMRFDRAVELLADPTSSLASVAISCGYYDQAHLNRDFRALADCSPTQWMNSQFTELVGASLTS